MSAGTDVLGPPVGIGAEEDHPQQRGADSRSAEPTLRGTARLALTVATALVIAVAVVAIIVRLAFASEARQWLAFPFSGVPTKSEVATKIFVHNLRAMAAVGGLLLVAQSGYWAARVGPVHSAVVRLGECLLGAMVAANLTVVGASLGAYGAPMVRAALPHGPLELGAYSLALALYLEGRRRPLAPRHIGTVMAISTGALAVAAVLETYVNL